VPYLTDAVFIVLNNEELIKELAMSDLLKATALVCTLEPSPQKSSSDLLAREVLDELKQHNVSSEKQMTKAGRSCMARWRLLL
jgi:hypothetical protein